MINDRGTKKWTSIMLPEHIKLINDVMNEQEKKPRPMLAEQELEEIGLKLQMAIHNDLTVQIEYYEDYDHHIVSGKIKKIDSLNKTLILNDYNKINFKDILNVDIH